MTRRTKRRFSWLVAAITAAAAGLLAMSWRTGTCTDYVAAAGECNLGPSQSTIIVAVLLWGLAIWLLCIWWSGNLRA